MRTSPGATPVGPMMMVAAADGAVGPESQPAIKAANSRAACTRREHDHNSGISVTGRPFPFYLVPLIAEYAISHTLLTE